LDGHGADADMRTLIVGDSQAAGTPGASLERLLIRDGDTVQRLGYVGHGAGDWRQMHWAEYQRTLSSFQPDRVVLIFGSNDAAGPRLRSAMQAFRESAAAVYYAGPPQYPTVASAQESSAKIRALARQIFGPAHLDAWGVSGPNVERAPDGLHFTAAGGDVWGRGIYTLLPRSRSIVGWVVGGLTLAVAAGILWATLRVNE